LGALSTEPLHRREWFRVSGVLMAAVLEAKNPGLDIRKLVVACVVSLARGGFPGSPGNLETLFVQWVRATRDVTAALAFDWETGIVYSCTSKDWQRVLPENVHVGTCAFFEFTRDVHHGPRVLSPRGTGEFDQFDHVFRFMTEVPVTVSRDAWAFFECNPGIEGILSRGSE